MSDTRFTELSAATRAVAEEVLSRQRTATASGSTAVLFYDASALDFGLAWEAGDQANRWLFPIQAEGPTFVYYVCLRLQQLGYGIGQVLFATAGQGALFYATVATAGANSSGVVGLLPLDTAVHDFGGTLSSFAADATVTLICDSTAADNDFQGTVYKGIDLVGPLAAYMNGKVVATDQAVVRNNDGTATTVGNVWVGDPQTGVATILCPAPGGGVPQSFPLAIQPVCG
jgi:hypothetical protein